MLRSKKKVTEGEEKSPKKSKLLSVPKLKKKGGEKTPKTPTTEASPKALKSKDDAPATPVKKPEAKKSVTKKSVKKAAETPERSSASVPGIKSPPSSTAPKKPTKTTKSTESPLKPTARAKSETTKLRKTPTPEVSKDSKTALDRKSKDPSKTAAARSTTPKSSTPTKGAAAVLAKKKKEKTKTGGETPKEKVMGVLKKLGSLGSKKNETPREKKDKKSKKGVTTSSTREASLGPVISQSPSPQTRRKSTSEGSSKTSPGAKSAARKGESVSSTLSPASEVQTETPTGEQVKEEAAEPAVVERMELVDDVIEEKIEEAKEIKQEEEPAEVEEAVEKPKDEIEEKTESTLLVEKPPGEDEKVEVVEEKSEDKLAEAATVLPTEAAGKPDPDDEGPELAVPVPPVADTVTQSAVEIKSVEKDADIIQDRALPSDIRPTLMVADLDMPPEGITGDEAMENLVSPGLEASLDVVPVEVTREEAAATAVVPAPASTASSASVVFGSEDLSVGGSLATTVQMHESGEDELEDYLAVPEKSVERTEVRRMGPQSISSLSSMNDFDYATPEEDVDTPTAKTLDVEDLQRRTTRRDVIPGARELLSEEDLSDDSSADAEVDTITDSRSLGSIDPDVPVEVDDIPMETHVQEEPKPQPSPQRQPETLTAIPSREPIEREPESDDDYQASTLSSLSTIDPDDFIVEEEQGKESEIESDEEEPETSVTSPVGLPPLGRLSSSRSKSSETNSTPKITTELQPMSETVEMVETVELETQPPEAVEPIAVQMQSIEEEPEIMDSVAVLQEQPKAIESDPTLIKTETMEKPKVIDHEPEVMEMESVLQEPSRGIESEPALIEMDSVAVLQEQSKMVDSELIPVKTETTFEKQSEAIDSEPVPIKMETVTFLQEQPKVIESVPAPIKADTVFQDQPRESIPESSSQQGAREREPEASVRSPEKKVTAPKGLPSLGLGLKSQKKAAVVTPVKEQLSKEPTVLPETRQLPKEPAVLPEAPTEVASVEISTWDRPSDILDGTPKTTITVEGSNESGSLAMGSDRDLDDRDVDLSAFGLASDAPDDMDNRTDEGRSPLLSPVPTLDGYHSGGFVSNLTEEDLPDTTEEEVVPEVIEPFVPEVQDNKDEGRIDRNVSIEAEIPDTEPIIAVETQQLDESLEQDGPKGRRGNTLINCAVYVLGGISGIAVTVLFFSQRGG